MSAGQFLAAFYRQPPLFSWGSLGTSKEMDCYGRNIHSGNGAKR